MSSWDTLLSTEDDSFTYYNASLFLHAPNCAPDHVPEVSSGYALIKNPNGAAENRLLKYEHVCAEDNSNPTKLYLTKVSKKLFLKLSNGQIFQGKKIYSSCISTLSEIFYKVIKAFQPRKPILFVVVEYEITLGSGHYLRQGGGGANPKIACTKNLPPLGTRTLPFCPPPSDPAH